MKPQIATAEHDRNAMIQEFLARSGWGDGQRDAIPGDASFRRYERIRQNGKTAILMDAPPEKEDVRPFVAVAEYLTGIKLRAPRVLAKDVTGGFLLLEDLGNDLYSRVLASTPEPQRLPLEKKLYMDATRVQAELYHRARKGQMPDIPPYDTALLNRELELFSQWYLPAILGDSAAETLAASYREAWSAALRALPAIPPVVTLRDYHADNLLVVPDTNGTDAVGLLDFQDAVVGSPAYDMVSFLEDARRDVSEDTVNICKDMFVRDTGISSQAFETAYALLGAQRNCKIVGIFTRLGARDGKYRYQHYLPRVWGHLNRDLLHPALAPVATWVNTHIPDKWKIGAAPFPDKLS